MIELCRLPGEDATAINAYLKQHQRSQTPDKLVLWYCQPKEWMEWSLINRENALPPIELWGQFIWDIGALCGREDRRFPREEMSFSFLIFFVIVSLYGRV